MSKIVDVVAGTGLDQKTKKAPFMTEVGEFQDEQENQCSTPS
jgi:hypothetical protein